MLMKMKERIIKEVEVEVEFPIYAKQDVSGDNSSSVYYTKRLSPDHHISLNKTHRYACGDGEDEYSLNIEKRILNFEDPDWFLGKGEYSLSKQEFLSVLEEFKSKLIEIGESERS